MMCHPAPGDSIFKCIHADAGVRLYPDTLQAVKEIIVIPLPGARQATVGMPL